MRPDLLRLLLASCCCLIGLAFCTLLLVRLQAASRQVRERISAVTGIHRSNRFEERSSLLGLSNAVPMETLGRRMLHLVGYDETRKHQYTLRLPIVLAVATVVALVLSAVIRRLLGPIGWAVLPVGVVMLSRSFHGWCESRVLTALYKQFPDALSMIVRAVRVGVPVTETIRIVGREAVDPTAQEFAKLADRVAIGVPLDDALREMASRNGLPEYRFFATALSLQAQTGGGLTETLENLATVIRKRVAARARARALASEARTSSYVLGALPIVTAGLLMIVNPGYISMLFTDPGGQRVLLAACVFLAVGMVSMRVIIRKSLS